jgi:hypothetical protein
MTTGTLFLIGFDDFDVVFILEIRGPTFVCTMAGLKIVKFFPPCDKRIGIALNIAIISVQEFYHTHYVACLHKEMNTRLAC